MKKFLPYLKSKELEKKFRQEQNDNNRHFFMLLCVIEVISFCYEFGKIISDGEANAKLVSSYVTIIVSYTIIFFFN